MFLLIRYIWTTSLLNFMVKTPDIRIIPEKNKNEFTILWMLKNNNGKCDWKEFKKNIPHSTLATNINQLLKKGLINKMKRGVYNIAVEGIKRLSKLEKGLTRKYPRIDICKVENGDELKILYIIIYNESCQWSTFPIPETLKSLRERNYDSKTLELLKINPSKLSRILINLEKRGFIKKIKRDSNITIYRETRSGYTYFNNQLENYNLGFETRFKEEKWRIQKSKRIALEFLDEFKITDEELKFHFINNILNSPDPTKDRDFYYMILLFLSWNYPSNHKNRINARNFCKENKINYNKFVYKMKKFFTIKNPKFHKLTSVLGECLVFREGSSFEKQLESIIKKNLRKGLIFDKTPDSIIYSIQKEILGTNLIPNKFMVSARSFITEYITFLEKFDEEVEKIGFILSVKSFIEKFKEKSPVSNFIQVGDQENNKSETLENLNLYWEKIAQIKKLKQINPKDINLYIEESRILCDKLELYEEALKIVEEGLKINDKEPNLFINQSMILLQQRQFNKALKSITTADQLKPNDDHILSKFSYIYFEKAYDRKSEISEKFMQDFEEALSYIKKALSLNQEESSYYLLQTEILIEVEMLREALDSIEIFLHFNPNDSYAYMLKASIYESLTVYEGAIDSTIKSIDCDESNDIKSKSFKYKLLAELLRRVERNAEALDAIEKSIEILPDDPDNHQSYQIKCLILIEEEKENEALKAIELALELAPNISIYYECKADILQLKFRFNEALECIQNALDLHSESSYLYLINSNIYYQMGDYSKAINNANFAIKILLNPKTIEFIQNIDYFLSIGYFFRAESYYAQEQYIEANEDIEKAINLNIEDIRFSILQALILAKRELLEDSLILMERLTLQNPKNNYLLYNHGKLLLILNDYINALEKIKKAIDNNEDVDDIILWMEMHYSMGNCYKKLGNLQLAKEHFQKAKKFAEQGVITIWIEKINLELSTNP